MVYRLSHLKPRAGIAVCLLLAVAFIAGPQVIADSSTYGMGTYGSCTYNACGISLSSSGVVNLTITPGASTSCTVASGSVSVLTDASSGYTLVLQDGDTNNQLVNGSNTIAASSGTPPSPLSLSGGTWGYRVDGVSSFGSGPTTTQSSSAPSALGFAGVPLSTGTADTIASTSSPADPAVVTSVWYGACVQKTQPSGTYSDSVTYTAVVN